jgi:aquaporin Z
LLAEAIGTFLLVLIGPGAVMVDAITGGALGTIGIALAFGLVVATVVYAFSNASGAHINPAVSVGLWSIGHLERRQVVPFVLAQCLGAIAASMVARSGLGPVASLGATIPSVGVATAFGIEWLLSFLLMCVILSAVRHGSEGRAATAGTIGAAVGLCALVGGPLTGASMNPARSLGPALVAGEWSAHWIYWLAPVTGMVVAGKLVEYLVGEPIARRL